MDKQTSRAAASSLRQLARAEEEEALSLIRRGARLRGSRTCDSFASKEWQRISKYLDSPKDDDEESFVEEVSSDIPSKVLEVTEVLEFERFDDDDDTLALPSPPPPPFSPPPASLPLSPPPAASPQRFGYEDLLSDVGRAYCGYDKSYFERATGTDEAVEEAAAARNKVAIRERNRDMQRNEAPTEKVATKDFWLTKPVNRSMTDTEFEQRLRDLRYRVEGAPILQTRSDWAKLGVVDAAAAFANKDTSSSPPPQRQQPREVIMTTKENEPPPQHYSKQPIETPGNDDEENESESLIARALALAQRPVEPPLTFAPLT